MEDTLAGATLNAAGGSIVRVVKVSTRFPPLAESANDPPSFARPQRLSSSVQLDASEASTPPPMRIHDLVVVLSQLETWSSSM